MCSIVSVTGYLVRVARFLVCVLTGHLQRARAARAGGRRCEGEGEALGRLILLSLTRVALDRARAWHDSPRRAWDKAQEETRSDRRVQLKQRSVRTGTLARTG